ncbi:hypothetical protein ACJDT4_01800 [Clostridium neuense]|uniref:Lipoprotein n=1 Tax=Clostridium neuense TaxID=1728934 RepID=A0ABW8TBX2_9CLOT
MRKNKLLKIINFLIISILIIGMLAGCGNAKGKHEAVKPVKDPRKIVQDKNYTKDLKSEKEVLDGQIYLQNGMVCGAIMLKNNVSDKDAKALAQKYADELKKTYKGMKINVQAVKKNKNVANITVES